MSKLTLDSVEWGEFFIGGLDGLFNVIGTKTTHPSTLESGGDIPRVTCAATNNAIDDFYRNEATEKGGVLAVDSATIGYVSYQLNDFIATDHVEKIVSKTGSINKYTGLFLKSCIDKSKIGKYGYGYKFSQKRIVRQKILLPIDSNSAPNWQFMEDYIKQEIRVQSKKVASYYENKLIKLGFELLDLEVEWKEFKVKELFEVKPVKGKSITNYKEGKIPYITTSSIDNGLNSFIDTEDNISIKNCISIDPIGGKSFYHDYDFVGRGGAGSAINLLYNNNIDKYSGLFICRALESSSFSKASYGVQLNGNRLKNLKLLLPIDKNGEPHWGYMNQFMKRLEKENIEKTLNHIYIMAKKLENKYLLKNVSWKEFFIEDICEIKSGKDIYERERIEGMTPYVTATANNNGIGYFISNKNATLQEKCISVNRNGSVGYSFYHSYPALFGNDTRKLIPKYSDDHVAKFISFMISSQKEKYGYGYKMGTARLKRQKILLPVNEEELIDYDFMKKYIILQEIKSIEQFIHKYSEN